jgi:hypothetical protein
MFYIRSYAEPLEKRPPDVSNRLRLAVSRRCGLRPPPLRKTLAEWLRLSEMPERKSLGARLQALHL